MLINQGNDNFVKEKCRQPDSGVRWTFDAGAATLWAISRTVEQRKMKGGLTGYLIHDFSEPIRDPLWQNINLSPGMKELISLESFQKLGRIKQLGPAFHVYPGAVHTRLNHSLGVLHLARKLLLSLLDREEKLPLTGDGVRAFLAAALLHDLGHFPFAHSFKELPLKDHEELTAEKVLTEPMRSSLKDRVGADPEMVAGIVDEKLSPGDSTELPFYRRLLSGVLDPDKLDYLNRDAYFCGVPYGIQDTEYILHKLQYHPEAGIALEADAVTAVENILFSKYQMYRTVYWHRVVRIATAMIKQAVFLGMMEGKIRPEELYWLDDEEFYRKFGSRDYRPLSLIPLVMERKFYKTAMETPFDPALRSHRDLLDLEKRFAEQERIARILSSRLQRTVRAYEVVVDIPEAISFEVNLPILTAGGCVPFTKSGSVFSGPVVEGFAGSLRMLRLFLPADIVGRAGDLGRFFS